MLLYCHYMLCYLGHAVSAVLVRDPDVLTHHAVTPVWHTQSHGVPARGWPDLIDTLTDRIIHIRAYVGTSPRRVPSRDVLS